MTQGAGDSLNAQLVSRELLVPHSPSDGTQDTHTKFMHVYPSRLLPILTCTNTTGHLYHSLLMAPIEGHTRDFRLIPKTPQKRTRLPEEAEKGLGNCQ